MDVSDLVESAVTIIRFDLLTFGVFVVLRRKKMIDPDSLIIPETDDYRDRILTYQVQGTNKFKWYDYLIIIIFSALMSFLYSFIFYQKPESTKDDKIATLATSILFFAIDIFLLFVPVKYPTK